MPSVAIDKTRQAIETAVYQRIVFPPECLRDQTEGSVYIKLTITPAGNVQQVVILKELLKPFDAAVGKAARQLRFQSRPAKEGVVRFTVGISWEKEIDWLMAHQPPARRQPTPHRNPNP